jgi:2-hydroxy-3-oxopropionate reductase
MNLQLPVPISFLGTGLMGRPMAMNLIRAGYQLTVWNRTASKAADLISAGARLANSPAEAVREAQAVVLMLENGAIVTELLFECGVAPACREGTLLIDMSSIAPAIAEDHARLVEQIGLRYIDAPVSGGTSGAEKGTLAIMAGGAESDLLDAGPIFAALGNVTHMGSQGRGQLCKLINQCIVAVTIGAVAEGLLLAQAGGADPAQVRKAIPGRFLPKSDPRTARAAYDRAELHPRRPDQKPDQGSQRRLGSRGSARCELAADATSSTIVRGSGGFRPGDA